jgi:hypothetical protein
VDLIATLNAKQFSAGAVLRPVFIFLQMMLYCFNERYNAPQVDVAVEQRGAGAVQNPKALPDRD